MEAIRDYIATDNETAAYELIEYIFTTINTLLPENPTIGRPGRVDRTREMVVHTSYIVAYQVVGSRIEILTVRHTSRLWPEAF